MIVKALAVRMVLNDNVSKSSKKDDDGRISISWGVWFGLDVGLGWVGLGCLLECNTFRRIKRIENEERIVDTDE